MPYQIDKLKVSVTYGKNTYRLTGLDTIAFTQSPKKARIFPKDGSGAGITQSTGKDQGDTITFTATYLPEATQSILFTIHDDPTGYCTLTISSDETNASGGKNRIVLDYATIESNLFQTNIDDTVNGKYSIAFSGKFKKTEVSYDAK